MKIYCVKCKKSTDTVSPKQKSAANGRPMMTGKCSVCGTNKTKFLSGKVKQTKKLKGNGIFNDYIMPRLPELHYVSPFTFKKHSFTGPGTKLHKRIDPKTKQPLPHSMPVNEVDKAAYLHDLAYEEFPDLQRRKIADNVMIDDLDAIRRDKKASWKTRGDAFLVGLAMKTKRLLGLGKKKKRTKKVCK